jgi:hypothetical protein
MKVITHSAEWQYTELCLECSQTTLNLAVYGFLQSLQPNARKSNYILNVMKPKFTAGVFKGFIILCSMGSPYKYLEHQTEVLKLIEQYHSIRP